MKRFVAAIVVLGLISAAALGAHFWVRHKIGELQGLARELVLAAQEGDEPAARQALDAYGTAWGRADKLLHMFVVHREMSELEQGGKALEEYLGGGDWELFREGSVRVLQGLEHMLHSQELNLGNIF
jgi:hypothetical protein